jgi:hypothetical protein
MIETAVVIGNERLTYQHRCGCRQDESDLHHALRACIDANKFTYAQLAQIEHLSPRVKLSIARGLETEHKLKIDYANLINPKTGYENNDLGSRVYGTPPARGRSATYCSRGRGSPENSSAASRYLEARGIVRHGRRERRTGLMRVRTDPGLLGARVPANWT